jgi:hypothetical protein
MIAQVRQCCLRWIKLYISWGTVILPFFLYISGQNPVTPEDGGMFHWNITDHPQSCTVSKPRNIIWSTSAMKTWKSKQERAWVSGHSLVMSTSCSFYWCTSMLNQNHILAHKCIKCINLTQALLKILLVCWMNTCGSFTNLRTVDTLTHTVHTALPVFFSSLNSQND